MRTFHVTINGAVHIVRAHAIDKLNGRLRFLDSNGKVTWNYAVSSVQEIMEEISTMHEVVLNEGS